MPSTFLVFKVKVAQSCPILCDPMDQTVHGNLQARILEWVAFSFSRGSSQPRERTQVSCIADGFLPAKPQVKPKNTGIGSLSLLQQIFLTQESNRGLLHCRQILYQLSHQGSPQLLMQLPYQVFASLLVFFNNNSKKTDSFFLMQPFISNSLSCYNLSCSIYHIYDL